MVRKLLSPVRQLSDGRWGFDDRFTTGKRVQVRRLTKSAAQQAHLDLSVLVANGRRDIARLDTIRLARFTEWERQNHNAISIKELRKQFIDTKRADKQLNPGYVANLDAFTRSFEDAFGDKPAIEVSSAQFRKFLDDLCKQSRHRNNIRDAIVAMYRFGREEKLLPDVKSSIETIKRLKIKRAISIKLWSPERFARFIALARSEFVPFYAINAFAGVRPEEIRPKHNSPKDPLSFEDFFWREGYINVRDETAKTGVGRHVPITAALRSFMEPFRHNRGPIVEKYPHWETRRIARLLEFDPREVENAGRHSFGTYWNALHQNILQLVEIMGTSIPIARSRYVRPIPKRVAKTWFAIRPKSHKSHKIIRPKEAIWASR